MAFLDEIGKKISQTGQSAVQKTKEMADVAKINSVIAEEEKKINSSYAQIGRLYVSIHRQDCEDEFKPLIHSVSESEEKISDWMKQIQDIKGVQRCTKCGAEIPKSAAFCSFCGSAMLTAQEPDDIGGIRCEGCGAVLKQGVRFCTSCGMPVPTTESVPLAGPTGASSADFPQAPLADPQGTSSADFPQAPLEGPEGAPSADFPQAPLEGPEGAPSADFPQVPPIDSAETSSADLSQTPPTDPIGASGADMLQMQPTGPSDTEMKCPACGAIIEEDSIFCMECGRKLR